MGERVHASLARTRQQMDASLVECPNSLAADCICPVDRLLAYERGLSPGEMSMEDVEAGLRLALESPAHRPRTSAVAAELIKQLAQRQGLRCSPADARKAGLVIGSMALLQAVLASEPSMQLMG